MPCQIRWVDMDAYKHVNNTGYLRYLEEGRLRMLGLGGPAGEDGWDSRALVIASIEIAYRRPLVFRPEPVVVVSAVTRLGRSSFDITQRIADDESGSAVVYATATSTMVATHRETGLSRPLLDTERDGLGRLAPEA
jgi:acyl-CoA thioester hydrolase